MAIFKSALVLYCTSADCHNGPGFFFKKPRDLHLQFKDRACWTALFNFSMLLWWPRSQRPKLTNLSSFGTMIVISLFRSNICLTPNFETQESLHFELSWRWFNGSALGPSVADIRCFELSLPSLYVQFCLSIVLILSWWIRSWRPIGPCFNEPLWSDEDIEYSDPIFTTPAPAWFGALVYLCNECCLTMIQCLCH